MVRAFIIVSIVVAAFVAAGWLWMGWMHGGMPMRHMGMSDTTPSVDVVVPALSAAAARGESLFGTNCAACHGQNAAGNEGAGPPLVHKIYEPSHHGDMAFVLAVRNGVRQHHWSYGNMPPIAGVDDNATQDIIAYVRALQRANGID